MKFKIFTALTLCFAINAFSQSKYNHGNKFDFDKTIEKDVEMVAGDANSFYMSSITNENTFESKSQIFVRKFDNTNNLKQTFTYNIPQMEKFAYINYLGSFDAGNNIVFITETYAGKLKKKNIYKIIFDKTAGTFREDLMATFPIESVMKSGTSYFEKSENGRYGAVVFYEHSPRKEPVKININVFETSNLKTVWEKQITGEAGSSDSDFFVSNSGNVGLIRNAKQNASLLYVTAQGQEEKFFTEKMKIVSETAVSIGSKDYLIAFNNTPKSFKVNASDFENLMLYDIAEGKIISNEVASQYNDGSKIVDINIPYSTVSGDNIYLFTESRLNAGTKKVKSPMGTMMIDETYYLAGDPRMVIINSTTGKIDNVVALNGKGRKNAELDLHALGIVNVKGNYFMKKGENYDLSAVNLDSKSVVELKNMPPYKETQAAQFQGSGDAYSQALLYRPDVKGIYYPRTYDGSKSAAIVAIENFDGK
ncbi:hypothetical protein [Chryseobacterium sp. Leaf394]|uniref:hypothetical protein n=1 Tax=Chryseobacterium sp. Leaf394 TaxID=1736361 RepID=UPI0006FD68C4|nr:hypothetical protein [Chryseobacterium sp. Leaf394]KQS89183.1 hypothetical protein ASG21_15460 [Chryseobacterium sp. Leaf394]